MTAAAPALFDATALAEVRRTLWPIYHPDLLAAERFVQRDLARTLERIAQDGAEAFYRGDLARRLARAAGEAGSPLSFEDLAAHRADWVEPLRVPYRGGEAASFPPPTQGFAALAILALLEGFDLAAAPDDEHVHLVVEATKLAFEDRDRYLTDPSAVPVPVERCLDPERLARRRQRIGPRAAAPLAGGPRRAATPSPSSPPTRTATPSRSSRASTTSSARGSWPATPACCSRIAAPSSRWILPTRTGSRRASAPPTRSSRPCISSRAGRGSCTAPWGARGSRRPRPRSSRASSTAE